MERVVKRVNAGFAYPRRMLPRLVPACVCARARARRGKSRSVGRTLDRSP